jgi:diguanylate cyclase (GGDEF)-like protein
VLPGGSDVSNVESDGKAALEAARHAFLRTIRLLVLAVVAAVAVAAFVASWLATRVVDSAAGQHLVVASILTLVSAPTLVLAARLVIARVNGADAVADAQQDRLDEEARHRDLESQLADALEMAGTEDEALHVIERGFATVLPHAPVELLLADNSHAHLARRAATSPGGAMATCSVASPQDCPAARRSRVHHFPDSEAVNACPKLAGREQGRCSALCIPVSVLGRTVGVIHAVRELGASVDPRSVDDLQAIANQAGARLAMLRVMAETQLQASTDGLTGLLNRRAFENRFLTLRHSSREASAAIAMADLDHFKSINDTYGHETGDRALRLFAETLRSTLRDSDLVSRHGGEEFAMVFPDSEVAAAAEALERVRLELRANLGRSGLPLFTASFGIVPARLVDDLDALLARADSALFEAKRAGRDRVVVHDGSVRPAVTPDGIDELVRDLVR